MKVKVGAWIGGLVLFVGVLFLGIMSARRFETTTPLIIAILLELIIFGGCLYVTLQEKKEKFCNVCKRQFDFENEVEYEELNRYTKSYNIDLSKQSRQKTESLTYKVAFNCHCLECGNTKTFTKKLDGGAAYSDGTVNLKDPEKAIKDYFRFNGLSVNDGKSIIASIAIGAVSIVLAVFIGFSNMINFNFLKGVFGPSISDKLSATGYYGTYYGVSDNFTEYKLTISDRRVELYTKDLMRSGGISTYDDGEQVFYTAAYMQKQFNNEDFPDTAALVLDKQYIFWITNEEGESPEFTVVLASGEHVELTTTVKNVETITGDPKNYYGSYKYDINNSITIYKDNCSVHIEGAQSNGWVYIYANDAIFNVLGIDATGNGLIVYNNYTDEYICFYFSGEDLLMDGRYKFEKK